MAKTTQRLTKKTAKKPQWSKDRPKRPTRDPMLEDLLDAMADDNRSYFAKANVSGLSPSTLKNWEDGKVRHPQSTSIQMAYKMLGYELKPVKIAQPARLRVVR